MPWPLSEAAPALFFSLTSLSKKVLYFLASRSPPEVLQAPLLFNFQLSTVDLCGNVSLFSLFQFLISIFQRRPKLSRRQPRQRREAPSEFVCAQAPLPPQPAQKILRPPFPLPRVTFPARRHQVAVAIPPPRASGTTWSMPRTIGVTRCKQ